MMQPSLLILTIILFMTLKGHIYAANTKGLDHSPPLSEAREMVVIEGQNFFFGIFDNVAWQDAETRCLARSMTLVTLDTQEKNDMILNFISDNQIYDFWYWSSGHRTANSSEWLWEGSQQPLTFSDWGPGQPDRSTEQEACLSFASGGSFTAWRGWDDDDCLQNTWPYVCEEVGA